MGGVGVWAGRDFPAKGCQMCDLADHTVIRATADSRLEAHGNRRLMHGKKEKVRTADTIGGDVREEK